MSVRSELRRLEADVGRLLERHERSKDLGEFGRYADDPHGFIVEVLNGAPWDAQVQILDSVRESPLTVVRSCNGAGKDWAAAHLALWWAIARGGLAILTGPTQRQVRRILFGEIRQAWSGTKLPGELFEQELRVDREAGAGIMGLTSSEIGGLTGFHAENVLGVITEAQSCEPMTYEALLACAVGESDRLLALGNPLHPSGEFFTISQAGSGWNAIRIPASDHPNVQLGETVIPGGVTRAFVQRIQDRYGESSPIYRSRVEGEFPTDSTAGMFRRDLLDAAVEQDGPTAGKLVAALDPARYGPDSTVLGIRHGPRLKSLESWSRLSTTETTRRTVERLLGAGFRPRRTGGRRTGWLNTPAVESKARGTIIIDAVGVGAGVADQLKDRGFRVVEFKAGRQAHQSRRYGDRRSEAAWHLRELLESGSIRLIQSEPLFIELLAHEWHADGSGRVQLEPKNRIRDRLGKSPDYADAVTMLFSGFEPKYARRRKPVRW